MREHRYGSIALTFRLTNGRCIVGYALGDDGMLFRGELLTDCDEDRARHEAVTLAEYWAGIDAEDETDPWHGAERTISPSSTDLNRAGPVTSLPDTTDPTVNNHKSHMEATS